MPIQIDESREMDSASRRTFRKLTQRTGFGAGAPSGTGKDGWQYYDTTNHRLYQSDGTGWVIMSEPVIASFVPNVASSVGVITTFAATYAYHRRDGYCDWEGSIAITNNGTGAGLVSMSTPIDSAQTAVGMGREILVTGFTLNVSKQAANAVQILNYDNTYPGGTGRNFQMGGTFRMITRYS